MPKPAMSLHFSSKVFDAKYDGTCGKCEDEFEAGTRVQYRNGKLVHAQCPPPEIPDMTPEQLEQVRAAICQHCFCVHAGEC